MISKQQHIRVATRRSDLALAQTRQWISQVLTHRPEWQFELVLVDSTGDLEPDRALHEFGGKGVFSSALEQALLDRRADLAIHSLKDLPVRPDPIFVLPALSARANPFDVLVTRKGTRAADLPPDATAGTGSPRRSVQLTARYPDWRIRPIRGNVGTRLSKLKQGDCDVLVLAAAGLERLGLDTGGHPDFEFEYLDERDMIPACGQGILAMQTLAANEALNALLAEAADDPISRLCYEAERTVIEHFGASCHAPVAAYASVDAGGDLILSALNALGGPAHLKSIRMPVGNRQIDGERMQTALDRLTGKVWLVGAGPGDPGLFTLKGRSLLETADAILFDRLGTAGLTRFMNPEAERIYVGKRAGDHALTQPDIGQYLVRLAREGKRVVRLKGGDPFVFGRGGEELLLLKSAAIPYEVVPGVTSSVAAPAYAGIPVTHRGLASSVHIITAHEGAGGLRDALNFDDLARLEGTLVFMMGVGQLPELTAGLLAAGKSPDTPCAMVSNGTLERQQVLHTTLKSLPHDQAAADIRPPAVTVIGDVAALGHELAWFHPRVFRRGQPDQPLAGRRILVNRSVPPSAFAPDMSLAVQLIRAGACPTEVCLTRVVTPPEMQRTLDMGLQTVLSDAGAKLRAGSETDGHPVLVLTSAHGVAACFAALDRLGVDRRHLADWRFAVVGSATADALKKYGYQADWVPEIFDSEHLAALLQQVTGTDDPIVAVRAAGRSPVLAAVMAAAGRRFLDLVAYETRPDPAARMLLPDALAEVEVLTFTSASGVRAFAAGLAEIDQDQQSGAKLAEHLRSLPVFAIGPMTAAACRAAGFAVTAVAPVHTTQGLTACLADYYQARIS